jgi:hypothetical protein
MEGGGAEGEGRGSHALGFSPLDLSLGGQWRPGEPVPLTGGLL